MNELRKRRMRSAFVYHDKDGSIIFQRNYLHKTKSAPSVQSGTTHVIKVVGGMSECTVLPREHILVTDCASGQLL